MTAIDDLLDLLCHERRGDAWIGRTPDWYGPVAFGGISLALTIRAACGDAPAGSRLHSLHAHFLRPVQGGREIAFRSDVVKAGRTFDLQDVQSLVNAGGRGTLRGVIRDTEGRIVASMAQEMLLRPPTP